MKRLMYKNSMKIFISATLSIILFSSMILPVSARIDTSTSGHLIKYVYLSDGITNDTTQWVTDYEGMNNANIVGKTFCYPYAIGMTDPGTFEDNFLNYQYQQYQGELAFTPGFSSGPVAWLDRGTGSPNKYPVSERVNTLLTRYVSVDEVANYIIDDMNSLGSSARILGKKSTNYNTNTQLASNEFMIAVRVTNQSRWNNGTWDYHVMRRMGNSGVWRHKPGQTNAVIQLSSGQTPSTVNWGLLEPIINSSTNMITGEKVNIPSYYDSDIIYMAVKDNFNVLRLTAKKASITMGVSSVYAAKGLTSTYNIEQPTIQPELAENKTVSNWSSSDTSVATVTTAGKITALKAGTAIITGKIDNATVNINVTVKNSTQTLGDANFDGAVTIKDSTAIQQYLSSNIQAVEMDYNMADVTKDGAVTIADATRIQEYLSGIISNL